MKPTLCLVIAIAMVTRVTAQDVASTQDAESAIGQAARQFVKSYNDQDSAAIASLFTEAAELTESDGTVFVGREEIKQAFDQVFAQSPDGKISLSVESIRFVTPDVAIEDGVSIWFPDGETATSQNSYRVAHVQRDGKWLMVSARTMNSRALTNYEYLRDLEWMVGHWVDESDEAVIETTVKWAPNKSFLLREFTAKVMGEDVISGTQRIGWDERNKQFRSWLFDSEGGFVEGVWTQVEGGYVIRSSGSLSDGTPVSGTSRVDIFSDDRFGWSMFNRLRGDEILPDVDIIIVKKPPPPNVAAN